MRIKNSVTIMSLYEFFQHSCKRILKYICCCFGKVLKITAKNIPKFSYIESDDSVYPRLGKRLFL